MRLAWGIVAILGLGLPASVALSAQQDVSGPAPTTVQPSAGAAQAEPPTEQKKEPQGEPSQTPPQQTSPPQAAPTEPTAEPGPEPQQKTLPQQGEPGIEASPSEPGKEPEKKTDAGAGGNGRRHAGKKRAIAAHGSPQTVIVRHGGADEPTAQIVTGMAPQEANRQRQHAEQLLRSTGETLKGADSGAFDGVQQETLSQIHNYMEGARLALKGGDISRGHMLAVKAGLLANDLVKHSQAAKEINSAR